MADEFKFPDEGQKTEVPVESSAVDDVEIEVIDDTPEKDRNRKPLEKEVVEPTDDELESYSEKVQARIKELTHARHDERRRAEALEREKLELERIARQMLEENRRLKQYVSTGERQFVETYKTSAEHELAAAKRAYKDAYEAGDSEALVAAQTAITEATLKLQKAREFRPTPLQEEDYVVQQQMVTPQRPELDEKTAAWQARNPWFGAPGYEEVTSFSLGLHQKLVNAGVDPRSDEYFERIDARLREVFPNMFRENASLKQESVRKPSAVVAPAARSSGAKRIQLTATQVALAKKLGLTPQQYAAELIRLEKQHG